jgi:hypothetical protein
LRHEIENRLIEQRSKNEEAAGFLIFTFFERKSKRLRKSYAAVMRLFIPEKLERKWVLLIEAKQSENKSEISELKNYQNFKMWSIFLKRCFVFEFFS